MSHSCRLTRVPAYLHACHCHAARTDGRLTVTVPAMGVLVLRPDRAMASTTTPPALRVVASPTPVDGWLSAAVEVWSQEWVVAALYVDRDAEGPRPRELVAVDDALPVPEAPESQWWYQPFQVDVAGLSRGDTIELTAVVHDRSGRESSTRLLMRIARAVDIE